VETVVNGDAAWVKDSITGARFLQGEEKAQEQRQAAEFGKETRRVGNWRTEYKEVRTLAEEAVEGKAAYKVQLTTPKGEVVIAHFDKHTGLLVRQEKDVDTPEGKVKEIEFYQDYRKVGDVVVAFAGRFVRGSSELRVTVERIEYNVDIPGERFALPPELKRLQKQP
jgi:hypothetical protein